MFIKSIRFHSRNPLQLARNRIKKQETDSCLTTYPSRKRQNGMGSMGVGEWRSDHRWMRREETEVVVVSVCLSFLSLFDVEAAS